MIKAVIKATGPRDERKTLLLGLSADNLSRLLTGAPIHISNLDLAELDLPTEMDIVLMGGLSEESILAEIQSYQSEKVNVVWEES